MLSAMLNTVLNPFDLRAALLAKHAQHVVLVHFPIALFLSGTVFDLAARIFRRPSFEVARWNFLAAAIMSLPTAATGILAWRWALEGQRVKGILLLHFWLAGAAVLGMCAVAWLRTRFQIPAEPAASPIQSRAILILEIAVCGIISLTGHLGGFLSGVNPGP
jgi:uncharacterized membrane protein